MMASSLLRTIEFNQNKIRISFISKFPTHWMSLRGMPFNQRNFFVPSFIKRARNSFFVTKYPESYQSNTIQSWKEKWEINLTKAERTSEENYLPWQWKKHCCIQQEHDKHKICVSPSLCLVLWWLIIAQQWAAAQIPRIQHSAVLYIVG